MAQKEDHRYKSPGLSGWQSPGCNDWDERIIAVAGSKGGADTAVVASAAPSNKMAALRIHEIICKPL